MSTTGPSTVANHQEAQPQHHNNQGVDQVVAQLDYTLTRLRENIERPRQILQRRIYVNKAICDGFNVLIPSNGNAVGVASNWFGFNGLVLDILGALFGAMRVTSLQKSTRGAERHLHRINTSYDLVKQHVTHLKDRIRDSRDPAPFRDALAAVDTVRDEQKELLDELESLYTLTFPSLLDFSPVNIIPAHGMLARSIENYPSVKNVFQHINLILENAEEIFVTPVRHPRSTIPDQVPLVVMGFGVVFLLISVILHAVATQFQRVWLGCIIITGIVCLYAGPGIMETDAGHSGHKGRVIGQKIEQLSQKLSLEARDLSGSHSPGNHEAAM